MDRHDQCVPSGASVCVVSRITSRLSAAWAFESLPPWLPPRGRSFAIPSSPSSANRRRQRPTLFWSVPSLAAISLFVMPPAAISTIRERSRSRIAALRDRDNRSSRCRSASDSSILTATRMAPPLLGVYDEEEGNRVSPDNQCFIRYTTLVSRLDHFALPVAFAYLGALRYQRAPPVNGALDHDPPLGMNARRVSRQVRKSPSGRVSSPPTGGRAPREGIHPGRSQPGSGACHGRAVSVDNGVECAGFPA